jgi:hypothetical protein
MLNSGVIWFSAAYVAAIFDWPQYYIADSDDLPPFKSGQSNFKFEELGEIETEF